MDTVSERTAKIFFDVQRRVGEGVSRYEKGTSVSLYMYIVLNIFFNLLLFDSVLIIDIIVRRRKGSDLSPGKKSSVGNRRSLIVGLLHGAAGTSSS